MPQTSTTPISRILDGYGGTPVALTAQVTLNPGDSIDLPADALRNGFAQRILIDSFRWTADSQQSVGATDPPAVATAPAVGSPGASVRITMAVEGRSITAGFTPLYSLGEADGQDVESSVLAVATGGASASQLLGAYSSGCWYLDHPLEILPGQAFSFHLSHTGLLNLPIVLSLAMAGRMGKDLPGSRWFPYVSAWVPSLDPANPATVVSTDRDLVNRTGQTIHVHRLTGRLLRLGVVCTPVATAYALNAEQVFPSIEGNTADLASSNWFASAVDSFVTVTMVDSGANDNVPGATPFRLVFEPVSRSWACDSDLESNGFYLVTLNFTTPAVIDQGIQPAIAMIGSYEV